MTKKPQQPENQLEADDRNIVPLDSSYEGGSFEDRLFLFWTDNRRIIVGVCVAIAVVLAGWGILSVVQARRDARIAAEYQEAVTIEEKQAFAERASPHPSAGAAFLEVADHYFSEGNYEAAAANYLSAADDLGDLPTAGRAQIGHGISLALSGQQAEALTYLEQVASDTDNYDSIRAEAYYHAATLAVELGQIATARDYIERVGEVDASQMWSSRAIGLLRSLPPEEAPETTEAPEAAATVEAPAADASVEEN